MFERKAVPVGAGVLFVCDMGGDYFEERRALILARAEAKNAPAEPTTARIAVGFSGELVQPSCAWRGRATASRRAKPVSIRVDFFTGVSPFWEGLGTRVEFATWK